MGRRTIDETTQIFRNNILKERENKTLKEFINYCVTILSQIEKHSTVLYNNLKGELAEIVIEELLLDLQRLMKMKNIDSIVMKNVVLLNRSTNNKLYSTEIDVCLVTPYKVYLFEVKCYKGNKTLTKECFLSGVSKIDVYKQSKYHLEMFDEVFNDCRYKYLNRPTDIVSPFKLIFFNVSCDNILDLREEKWKNIIPCIEYNNFYDWFLKELNDNNYTKYVQWDLIKLSKAFKLLNSNRKLLSDYHVNRLKAKNKGGHKHG